MPEHGIDVFVSPDLQGKIKDAMNSNCQEINDKCYKSVRDLLVNPNTELEARQIAGGALVVGILALLYPWWYKEEKPVPVPIHIPPAQISQASTAVSATVIVVATGSGTPTITITPEPEPTTVTG